jgi:iron-sulfur cluster repair protein YtfE (RIC family)
MTMQSINAFLTDDHGQLDALLEAFQEAKASDMAKAKDSLARFVSALNRHLQWEETILFPLFEQKLGQTGLIRTLLGEHEEIREWLNALCAKVRQDDADTGYEETMLVEELGGHNAREEYTLYPELDKHLTEEEKARVFEAMAAIPEGA